VYEYFKGKVVERHPTMLILEHDGVGYRFQVPLSTYESLSLGEEVMLFAYLYVSDEDQRLYGFATKEERDLFRSLLAVSGVGPSLALAILSGCSVEKFHSAVESSDVDFLRRIKGVGKKTAQRLILELKGKLPPAGVSAAREAGRVYEAREDAYQALLSLGFPQRRAAAAVEKALERLAKGSRRARFSVQELLREALKCA